MKKFLAIMLAAVMLLSLSAGCGPQILPTGIGIRRRPAA